MKKIYLVSEDEYSGQVVIVCETREVEVDTYIPTPQQLESAIYLYRELPKRMEIKTQYIVKAFYHYELGEFAYIGDCTNNLFLERTFDKDLANEYFKQAVLLCK